jgi:hypothetical protein
MDAAFLASERVPDLVLAGHVHSYQRFSRDFPEKTLPYIVAGTGGFANSSRSLHKLQKGLVVERLPFTTLLPTVRLASCDVMNAGFLRARVSASNLKTEYFAVSFDDPPFTPKRPIEKTWASNGSQDLERQILSGSCPKVWVR